MAVRARLFEWVDTWYYYIGLARTRDTVFSCAKRVTMSPARVVCQSVWFEEVLRQFYCLFGQAGRVLLVCAREKEAGELGIFVCDSTAYLWIQLGFGCGIQCAATLCCGWIRPSRRVDDTTWCGHPKDTKTEGIAGRRWFFHMHTCVVSSLCVNIQECV